MSSLVVRRARAVKPWLTARLVVLALELVLGVSAVAGGIGLLGGGAGMPESYLDGSPFEDYTVPGLYLLTVIGGGALAAAALTFRHAAQAGAAAVVMGVLLIAWLTVETAIIGYHGGIQPVMLGLFFPLGAALVVLGAGEARAAHWPAR